MIEQFLQTALGFIKEIWFQLDSRFDLENAEAFKLLKPYLIQLQDNPLYMGASLAALFLVPYALIKVRSISRDRERKLDELMEEMEEEEYDDDDPRRLRRSEVDDDTAKPLFGSQEEDSPSDIKVLDEMEGSEDSEDDLDDFELEPSQPFSDNEESIELGESAEPVSSQLTESEFDKDLNEFMSLEENIEPSIDDSTHDQAIKELRDEGELTELDEQLSNNYSFENISEFDEDEQEEAIKELQDDGEMTALDKQLSDNDPFANYSELAEDEQDKAIKDLQDEMERTINELTVQIEEPTEAPSSIKDLSQIHIGGDATIDDEYSHEDEFYLEDTSSAASESLNTPSEEPLQQEESTPVSELSDSEVLASLEPELEDDLDLETEPDLEKTESIAIPKTRDYEPELSGFTFEAESDIPQEEPEASAENFSFEAESMRFEETPESDTERVQLNDDYVPSGEADSLIDRLKFLQTRFENRYQPTERPPAPIEKSVPAKDYASFTEPRRYSSPALPPDSKKYMDLLESFVFMKDQKKHK
ncbi:MAG: hypothetical protein H8E42_02960 [Nitrospinae bacterium]|nr:hypothetical protein [Nitrospinota bacterium]MBL7020443.1 hypothetical protein [Nitrospinaceae bacterium]